MPNYLEYEDHICTVHCNKSSGSTYRYYVGGTLNRKTITKDSTMSYSIQGYWLERELLVL